MMDGSMMSGGWMVAGMVISTLIALLVLGALVYALVRLSGNIDNRRSPTALGVLEDRFASGEIDDEEFARRRQALRG